jgi:sulfite reductase (NADPH) hemoprotein beta-component
MEIVLSKLNLVCTFVTLLTSMTF